MRGTWQTTGGDGNGWALVLVAVVVVVLLGGGAGAALSEAVLIVGIVVGVVVLLVLVAVAWLLVRRYRSVPSAPVLVTRQQQALPAPEPRRAAPPAQPPMQITNNFYGYSAAEVARAVAEQHRSISERTDQ